LKKQQLRAQAKGDVREEAALCNAIGDRYFHLGESSGTSGFYGFFLE